MNDHMPGKELPIWLTLSEDLFYLSFSFLYIGKYLTCAPERVYLDVLSVLVCKTVHARVVIFGILVDNDVLYFGNSNQSSPAYSYLYLSDFLSFHTSNNVMFVLGFNETVQARVVVFSMQVDNDMFYCWTAFSCFFFPVYVRFSFFAYFK